MTRYHHYFTAPNFRLKAAERGVRLSPEDGDIERASGLEPEDRDRTNSSSSGVVASSGKPIIPACLRTRGTVSIASAGGMSSFVVTSRSFRRRALTSTRDSREPTASLYACTA